MDEIQTKRLILRPFRSEDYDDLYEFLSQLRDDEFEGYPGITYENGRNHLAYRLGSDAFFAIVLKETGKVVGNIYCGKRDYLAKEVGYIVNRDYRRLLKKAGLAREAHLRRNIFFHRDAEGAPIWKDTYICARLGDDV